MWCKGPIYARPRAYDFLAGTAAMVAVQWTLGVPFTPCAVASYSNITRFFDSRFCSEVCAEGSPTAAP